MGHTITDAGQAEGLLGAIFTTPKELRHLAEQSLGQLFVPTEMTREDGRSADLVLRPAGRGVIHVHAERERERSPFHVTRVDVSAD